MFARFSSRFGANFANGARQVLFVLEIGNRPRRLSRWPKSTITKSNIVFRFVFFDRPHSRVVIAALRPSFTRQIALSLRPSGALSCLPGPF